MKADGRPGSISSYLEGCVDDGVISLNGRQKDETFEALSMLNWILYIPFQMVEKNMDKNLACVGFCKRAEELEGILRVGTG